MKYLPPQLEKINFDIAFLSFVYPTNSVASYLGTYVSEKIHHKNNTKILLIIAVLMSGSLLLLKLRYQIYSIILVYFILSFLYSPFQIILQEVLHHHASDRYRATMLAISMQIENFGTIIFDPAIGWMIDRSGFQTAYYYMGLFGIVIIISLYTLLRYIVQQKPNRSTQRL